MEIGDQAENLDWLFFDSSRPEAAPIRELREFSRILMLRYPATPRLLG
jgi:hypothetical protein